MYVNYEHEIKKDNGDKLYIKIRYGGHRGRFVLDRVGTKKKGKRKIEYIDFGNDSKYRFLDLDDRRMYEIEKYLEIVSFEQVKEAIIKSWENIKPDINSVDDLH